MVKPFTKVWCVMLLAALGFMLAGCGGSQPPIGAPGAMSSAANRKTFDFTGYKQTFIVPSGVNQLRVTALGASGGNSTDPGSYGSDGGNGGRVAATIPVRPGEKFAVFVGGAGGPSIGGFDGGGAGGTGNPSGGYSVGGGGRRRVRY